MAGPVVWAREARYESIRTQRQIRGEHDAIGDGPTADCFDFGDFFPKQDYRTQCWWKTPGSC